VQPLRVELIDSKHTDATRRAPFAAGKRVPASAFGVRKCGIDDLNQFLILRGWKAKGHIQRIPIRGIAPQLSS
jgi:hypothetical protein